MAERLSGTTGMALVLCTVVLFSVLLYIPTVRYSFVWDDVSLIPENLLLADSDPLELLGRNFWAGSPEDPGATAQSFYRPLTVFSFWLDLKLAGANPLWFHVVNVLLNAAVAAMVTLILWELLHSAVWAGLGGLLFAAHSAHVESVAFISGRTDLLAGLFAAVATFGLLRGLRKRQAAWAVPVLVGFPLALLSKETAIVFPLLVVLAPLLTRTSYDRRLWILVAATAALALGYLILRSRVVGAVLPFLDLSSPASRLLEAANTFGLYIGMFFWPFGHHQVKYPADPSFAGLTPYALVALVFVVVLPLLAVRRRFRISLFGYFWTLLFLLPVVNLVNIGPQAAERLLYLPSAGLVFIVIALLSRLLRTRRVLRRTAGLGLLAIVAALGIDTIGRSRVWQDEGSLYAAMAKEAPTAPSAYANLAKTLRLENPDSAIGLYRRALKFDPGYASAHLNLGVLLSSKGVHDSAIHHLATAVKLDSCSFRALNNLGLAFFSAGLPESALVYFDRSASIDSTLALTHLNRAGALMDLGETDRATHELHRALEVDSAMAPAHIMLADQFERNAMLDSAASYLARAAASDSTRPSLANRLGTLQIRIGDTSAAIASYRKAVELDSCFVPALFNLAILHAARRDTASALLLAARAHRLRPDLAAVSSLYRQLDR